MLSIIVFAWLCTHGLAVPQSVVRQPLFASVAEQLKSRIEAVGRTPSMTVRSEIIGALASLARVFEYRGFRPLWTGDEGLLPQADALRNPWVVMRLFPPFHESE
jgi:hypothetical protein